MATVSLTTMCVLCAKAFQAETTCLALLEKGYDNKDLEKGVLKISQKAHNTYLALRDKVANSCDDGQMMLEILDWESYTQAGNEMAKSDYAIDDVINTLLDIRNAGFEI